MDAQQNKLTDWVREKPMATFAVIAQWKKISQQSQLIKKL